LISCVDFHNQRCLGRESLLYSDLPDLAQEGAIQHCRGMIQSVLI
jgi:hypothetical protein